MHTGRGDRHRNLPFLQISDRRDLDQHTFTDIDYADDVALLVDKEESFHAALVSMDEEAS